MTRRGNDNGGSEQGQGESPNSRCSPHSLHHFLHHRSHPRRTLPQNALQISLIIFDGVIFLPIRPKIGVELLKEFLLGVAVLYIGGNLGEYAIKGPLATAKGGEEE